MLDRRLPAWTGYNAGQDPTVSLFHERLLTGHLVWTRGAHGIFEGSGRDQRAGAQAHDLTVVTITDSSPDSITEIPQASIGVVGLF